MSRQNTGYYKTAVIAILIFLATRPNLDAQATPPASQENVTPASGPDSRADWNVAISTSGGFDGQGRGGFSITSTGGLTCSSTTPCARQIQKPALQPLDGFINSATLPQTLQQTLQFTGFLLPIPVQTSTSVCLDCIETTMSIRIRDSKGIEWTYTWSWDVTTQSSVPVDIMRIYRAAAELAK